MRLRLLQIARVKSFSEPPINRSNQFARLLRLALVAPEAREVHCGFFLVAYWLAFRALTTSSNSFRACASSAVEATAAVATVGKGDYPEGSVLQLMPNEVMIKQQQGFNPETQDWEFFYIDVDKDGSKIFARGFADVNNRLGMNCFACHSQAKPEFDLACEQDHGCAPIPVTRAMFGGFQADCRRKNDERAASGRQNIRS